MIARLYSLLLLCMLSGCSDSIDKQTSDTSEAENSDSDTVTQTVASSASVAAPVNNQSRSTLPGRYYAGASICADCHSPEHENWLGSHHDLAMQIASQETVLGDFNDTRFEYFDTVSVFHKGGEEDEKFMVNTEGPDGELQDFEVAYTFGVEPLQQYLIELPGGKLQALSIVWDSRPAAEGGQRWYHLYPDEKIAASDELHWTGINQNWNFMCADCHSTNLQKNYDLATQTYNSTWSEIDVSCEACHGPGSLHVELAQQDALSAEKSGFSVTFNERDGVVWQISLETGNASPTNVHNTRTEIETCAQCHSRRSTIHGGARPGDPFLEHFSLSLLDDSLYYADGQVNGEVYVYGSFLQSKMYKSGVTCSNCHEPHSLQLRAEGNALCAQCHLNEKYNNQEHHLHATDTAGAQCVSCHMPDKTYMGVDVRRDHSFRIPRPDLSVALGTPNACNSCHTEEKAEWAVSVLENKFGENTNTHYAYALTAGRLGLPEGEGLLSQLALDESQPAIVRGTAVSMLPRYFSQQTASIMQIASQSEEPLIGLGLAYGLQETPRNYRAVFALPLLYDMNRASRQLAARSMAGISLEQFSVEANRRFNAAQTEYVSSETYNSDRPESLVNLAGMYSAAGQSLLAQQYYEQAIALAPWYTPAYINMADHYRQSGDEISGAALLQSALDKVRDKATIQHAFGLALVRTGRTEAGLENLKLAAESPDATDRYKYVYAIGLNSFDLTDEALEVLEQAREEYPQNMEILSALISINRDQGNTERAAFYEEQLP